MAVINNNFATLDAEAVTKVFKQTGNNNAIITGKYNDTRYGQVLYDVNGVPRILIGQAPDDGRPGIWISVEGQNVLTLLGG